MEFLVFSGAAAISVASAIMMVVQRNAMYSALFLVLNFFCLSLFYVLLGAYFLAVVQVAVYAGAIMVLLLFVIMLLNVAYPEAPDRRLGFLRPFGLIAAVVLVIELVAAVLGGGAPGAVAGGARTAAGALTTPAARATTTVAATAGSAYPSAGAAQVGHTQLLASVLFTRFLLPFEVTSLILLGAVLGAAALTRKQPDHAEGGGSREGGTVAPRPQPAPPPQTPQPQTMPGTAPQPEPAGVR